MSEKNFVCSYITHFATTSGWIPAIAFLTYAGTDLADGTHALLFRSDVFLSVFP